MRSFSRRGGWSEHLTASYRSGLEELIAKQLADAGITPVYEGYQIKYIIPASEHTYTPDWVLPNGIIIETKGIFSTEDRQKHLLIRKQHPNLDIRLVFSNAKTKLYKGSKTSYADWCTKNGFKYATKSIPAEWLKEKKHTDLTGLIPKKKRGEKI